MNAFSTAYRVARAELSLFRRYPRLRLTLPGLILIPALYAFIYLDSVWDPASRTPQLPVTLVNLDRGVDLGTQGVNLGDELAQNLQTQRHFGYQLQTDPEKARQDVREGRSAFALVIPADFTSAALSASSAGAGKLIVFASEGNNYVGAGFARRFAVELGHQVNETLNERRWATVLGTTASSANKLEQLRSGLERLHEGAEKLDSNLAALRDSIGPAQASAQRLHEGSAAWAEGSRALATSLRAVEARRPAAADLALLRDGMATTQAAQVQLRDALARAEDGARRLALGLTELREEVAPIPLIGDRAIEATAPLLDGALQLQAGLRLSRDGTGRLIDGAQQLQFGVTQLVDGLGLQAQALSAIVARLPADDRLDEAVAGTRSLMDAAEQFRSGTVALQSGSTRLSAGLGTLLTSLPASVDGPRGSARGLAASVEPHLEIEAPVRNNGMGFLPNFLPVGLWLGAVMTAFIFHLRRVPVVFREQSRLGILLGKMTVLGGVNLAQAGCLLVMCTALLGLQPVHALGLASTMMLTALTFMLLILLLVRLLGDLGKGAALMLLILQLSAAGGVVPIELSSDFYGLISPWLPFTWAVRAVRASAFGAFGHEWGAALGVLCLFTATLVVLLLFVGRWQFVERADHRPAMDV